MRKCQRMSLSINLNTNHNTWVANKHKIIHIWYHKWKINWNTNKLRKDYYAFIILSTLTFLYCNHHDYLLPIKHKINWNTNKSKGVSDNNSLNRKLCYTFTLTLIYPQLNPPNLVIKSTPSSSYFDDVDLNLLT